MLHSHAADVCTKKDRKCLTRNVNNEYYVSEQDPEISHPSTLAFSLLFNESAFWSWFEDEKLTNKGSITHTKLYN